MDWTRICHGKFILIQCYQSFDSYIIWVCIFLTNPQIINNNSSLFPGEHQYRCHSYLLKKFIEDNKEDLTNDGSVENLGSHYIRKGESSYYYSAIKVYPSIL